MADVRCPHCNSINPGDADTCWNCDTPLQPEQPSNGSLDWLSDLRSDSDAVEAENEPGEPDADPDAPDWLQRIRQRSQYEQSFDEPDAEAAPDEEDLPDWLKELQGPFDASETPRSEEDTIPPPAGGVETTDWFSNLADVSPQSDEPEKVEAPQGDEIPEWLLEDLPETQPPAQEAAAPADLPDWLSQEETPAAGEQTQAFQRDELPDWLLEGAGETGETGPVEAQPASGDELPDWRAEQPQEAAPDAEQAGVEETSIYGGDLPDWLSGAAEAEPEDVEQAPQTAGLPDWLSELPVESETGETSAADDTAAFAAEDLPDWLTQAAPPLSGATAYDIVGDATGGEEMTPTSGADELEAEPTGLPDWLVELPVEGEPESASPLADETTAYAAEDLPDWLTQAAPPVSGAIAYEMSSEPAGEEASQPEETAETEAEEELPRWMFANEEEAQPGITEVEETAAGIQAEETEATQAEAAEDAEAEEDLAVSAFEMEELPDWLSEEDVELPQAEASPSRPAFIMDEGEEIEEPVIEQAHPFSGEDIPAWLSAEDGLESEEVEAEDLTRTTLPNWVEAMRPVEAVSLGGAAAAASAEETHIEKAGPLAGLTGILPADATAVEYGRPPTYSMRLRVSDKQRASAALLETVLEEESKPRELPRERAGVPQAILRLLVGILLITVIILSGGLAGISGSAPAGSSDSLVRFNQQINALPTGGVVLLAVEFDPGYSGEMNLVGQGIVERLLARDNRLVLVSTSIAGPVLGEQMILAAREGGFSPGDRVTNLGFLPAGVVSLKEFALAPQLAARYGMDWVKTGQNAWSQPALQGVQRITDFNLVLVLTDSGDTGRMWIEQVQPHLGDVPILMVSTAQAAPILYPYVTGGQLDGLVSGLTSGRAFGPQRLSNEIQEAWLAFRAGILVTIALVLIGVLFRGISTILPGPKS